MKKMTKAKTPKNPIQLREYELDSIFVIRAKDPEEPGKPLTDADFVVGPEGFPPGAMILADGGLKKIAAKKAVKTPKAAESKKRARRTKK